MKNIAVIKTGGKQYKVKEGDIIDVEKLSNPPAGGKLDFTDLLNGKKVSTKLLENIKTPKKTVIKFNPKKRYKRTKGHRQTLSQIKIEKIA